MWTRIWKWEFKFRIVKLQCRIENPDVESRTQKDQNCELKFEKLQCRNINEPSLISEGLPGVLGNKEKWPFTFREQEIYENNF